MSSNPYINYYTNQAGSGIGGFQGARFQRGQGFFGNVFKSAILPLLKYFGKKALATGGEIANDALAGVHFVDSVKNRGKKAAEGFVNDAANRATQFIQTGRGQKRRKRQTAKTNTKRRRKTASKKEKSKSRKQRKSINLF